MKKVIIHTDGACSGNPGPGGYAGLLSYQGHTKEIIGGFHLTTNNRMELYAAIAALETLKESCDVTLFTDSQYLFNGITKGWALAWQKKGWTRGKKTIPNRDLWERLLALVERHEITFEWVRGHNENEGNERCDKMAREAINGGAKKIDHGYEERNE